MKRIKRHPFLIFWIIGVVALVASTAGAISALHSRQTGEPLPQKPGAVVAAAGPVFQGTVDTESGVIGLFPTQPGRVVEVLVHENDKVKAGAPLMRMDDRLAKQRLQEAKADLDAGQAQLSQAQSLPEQHKLKVDQQQAAIDAMKSDLEAARAIAKRKQELAEKKQISPLEAEAANKMVDKLEAGVRAEEAKLRELNLLDPQAQLTRAKADVEAKRARYEQAQLGLDECTLKAPSNGEILQIQAGPGSFFGLQTTQPAMQFCPDRPRIVRAEVEQEFARRIHPGQSVDIEDESGGKEKWHGKVLRVSNWYTQRRSQQEAIRLTGSDVRTLECIIELDKGEVPFRLGQRVRAIIGKE
jgi:multidrug resistance efflux pump